MLPRATSPSAAICPATALDLLAFRDFKQTLPIENRTYFSIEGFFRKSFLKSNYTDDIAAYNKEHGTHYAKWQEIHLTRRLPTGTPKEREGWETFVRTILNLLWIRADAACEPDYQRFLQAKYQTPRQPEPPLRPPATPPSAKSSSSRSCPSRGLVLKRLGRLHPRGVEGPRHRPGAQAAASRCSASAEPGLHVPRLPRAQARHPSPAPTPPRPHRQVVAKTSSRPRQGWHSRPSRAAERPAAQGSCPAPETYVTRGRLHHPPRPGHLQHSSLAASWAVPHRPHAHPLAAYALSRYHPPLVLQRSCSSSC